jgi:Fic family protein
MNTLREKILHIFIKNKPLSSGDLFAILQNDISQVTIKRYLTELVKDGFLKKEGKGRNVTYLLSPQGIFLKPYDAEKYNTLEIDERDAQSDFNFEVFDDTTFPFFTTEEIVILDQATEFYKKNFEGASDTIFKKEVERFTIELSWKSSKIEGNTYTLLDTERLIREGIKSSKNTEAEAVMILNHKKALEYIFSNRDFWKEISISKIESLHELLTRDLGITRNIRDKGVGITGTSYKPIDNKYQIRDVLEVLCVCVNKKTSIYEKALLIILGLSYIQPFEDGNKRTARLVANAVLLAYNYAPLSYRSVNEVLFRETCLVFYEQNSIEPFKKIFIEQYIFAANNYNIGKMF